MMFQRGDVVLVPFPYTDLSAAKHAPLSLLAARFITQFAPNCFWPTPHLKLRKLTLN